MDKLIRLLHKEISQNLIVRLLQSPENWTVKELLEEIAREEFEEDKVLLYCSEKC